MTTQLSIPATALSEKEIPSFPALTYATRATMPTLSRQVDGIPEKMYAEAARLGLPVAGPMEWIYTGATGDAETEFDLEIALPIARPGEPSDTFAYKIYPPFRCLAYTHSGPWSDFQAVYGQLFGHVRAANQPYNDQVREVYAVVDLDNQENCVTEIQIGLH